MAQQQQQGPIQPSLSAITSNLSALSPTLSSLSPCMATSATGPTGVGQRYNDISAQEVEQEVYDLR